MGCFEYLLNDVTARGGCIAFCIHHAHCMMNAHNAHGFQTLDDSANLTARIIIHAPKPNCTSIVQLHTITQMFLAFRHVCTSLHTLTNTHAPQDTHVFLPCPSLALHKTSYKNCKHCDRGHSDRGHHRMKEILCCRHMILQPSPNLVLLVPPLHTFLVSSGTSTPPRVNSTDNAGPSTVRISGTSGPVGAPDVLSV